MLLTPPTQLQPEDFDRLHNINWQFTLQFPDDYREGPTWGTVFKNFGVFLTYNAQSGTPFTRTDAEGQGSLSRTSAPAVCRGSTRVTSG